MKKLIILCSLLMLTISCDKNEEFIEENSVNLIAITDVNNRIGWEQRDAFNSLNAEEKVYLWENKLDKLLKTKSLNKDQINVIIQLKNILSPDLYSEDENKSKTKDLSITNLTPEIILNFSGDEIYSYFANLHEDYNSNRSFGCECNKRDDWCISSYSCNSADCTSHGKGCGFLWSKPCNGDCITDTHQ